jgi:hypothetical protein
MTSFQFSWRHIDSDVIAVLIRMAALWVQALPPEPDQNKRFRGNPGLREMPNRDSPPIMYF